MNIESVLNSATLPIGEVVTLEGVLMENARRPYIGRSTSDWEGGRCICLVHDGLFDRLLDLLFPNIIGGGNSLFLYPATAVGLLGRDPADGSLALTELQSVRVDVSGEQFMLSLT